MLKASFVIPSFNSAAWLPHAISSAQKQTHPDIEVVVVDDGSTDSTPEVMSFLCERDKRIKYIRLDKNLGRSEARNIGNSHAEGEVLLVLDADDVAYPDRAKLSIERLKKADFVHGSCDVMDAIGTRVHTHIADVFNREKAVKEGLNYMVHSTCAYTKDLASKVRYRGGEVSDLGIDDWAFQIEAAFAGYRLDHIAPVIGAYRDLSTGISKTRDREMVIAAKRAFMETLQAPLMK